MIMLSRLMKCIDGIDAETGTAGAIDWNLIPQWAEGSMQEPTALRIANQNQFYGEQQLNRLQFAMMLAKSLGIEQSNITEEIEVFMDQTEIDSEHLGYILALRNLGIVTGDGGDFYQTRLVTRSEVAVMMNRVLDILE